MSAQYCTFTLDGQLFGVPVHTVQEVLRRQVVTVVPLAPPAVVGLLNLRGQIVPTIDLRVRLGRPRRAVDVAAVHVVIRTTDGPTSLLVDDIGDVLAPPATAFEPAPDTVPVAVRALVTGVCKLPDRLMLVLDTERAVAVTPAA